MDWITPSIIGGAVLAGSALIGLAITEHSATLHRLMEHNQIPQTITDDNWRSLVEQLITDITGDPVDINAFSQMSDGRHASMRFVASDARVYVFAIRPRLSDCHGCGRAVADEQANAELHTLWRYLMLTTEQAGPLPRHAHWYLLPAQAPQNKADPWLKFKHAIAHPNLRWPNLRRLIARL